VTGNQGKIMKRLFLVVMGLLFTPQVWALPSLWEGHVYMEVNGQLQLAPDGSLLEVYVNQETVPQHTFKIVDGRHVTVIEAPEGSTMTFMVDGISTNATSLPWANCSLGCRLDLMVACGDSPCLGGGTTQTEGTTPAPSGGGGGGGQVTPSLFKDVDLLTPSVFESVLEDMDLKGGRFFVLPARSLAPIFVLTGDVLGDYPAPEDQTLRETLNPILYSGDPYMISAMKAMSKWTHADTVVISRGDLEVDSYAAVAYAKALDAPLLLTEPGRLSEYTIQAIGRFKPSRIVIVGGPVAVSDAVEESLKGFATVERIWGENREETATALARSLDNFSTPDMIIISNGQDPSMDSVLVSASYGAPILYVRGGEIPQSLRSFLEEHRDVRILFSGIEEKLREEILALR
jgi:hypothetical protein